eukprot:s2545_g6.t1
MSVGYAEEIWSISKGIEREKAGSLDRIRSGSDPSVPQYPFGFALRFAKLWHCFQDSKIQWRHEPAQAGCELSIDAKRADANATSNLKVLSGPLISKPTSPAFGGAKMSSKQPVITDYFERLAIKCDRRHLLTSRSSGRVSGTLFEVDDTIDAVIKLFSEVHSLLELLDVSASHVAVINVTTNRAQRKGLPGLD